MPHRQEGFRCCSLCSAAQITIPLRIYIAETEATGNLVVLYPRFPLPVLSQSQESDSVSRGEKCLTRDVFAILLRVEFRSKLKTEPKLETPR